MDKQPKFSVIEIGGVRFYAVKIPDTTEGIAMLDEVGRMFSHRGDYDTAKRIAGIVDGYKTGTGENSIVRTRSKNTKPGETGEQDVRKRIKAAQVCTSCGRGPHSKYHDKAFRSRPEGHAFRS